MKAVAAMVTSNGILADVGTDHGYVPIALVQRQKIPGAIAMDINKGPLARAKENIAAAHLEDYIQIRLSDGVEELEPGEADSILIAGMAAATAACTRKPVVPEFSMLSIDTLIGTPANGCKIEFRFATIANAAKSPALRSIEAANAEYFFELEDFGGTARQAVDSAIRQIAAEMLPDSVEQTMGTYEISAEAEVTVTDSLVTYIISRWSFTGGAHGMYGMECHTYSLAGGDELSSADLFSEQQLHGMETLLRKKLYEQYGADSDEELAAQGFFPEYISLTENFQVTPEGITFYYNPYDLGCYALGAVEVTMTREELENL